MMKLRNLFLLFCCVLAAHSLASAQIPRMLSYQGVLADSLGNPKSDGSYSLTFRLYDVATGGTALWSETKTLAIKRGLFSTLLGDQAVIPQSVKFDKEYWLGIQLESQLELSPRIPLAASGYSFHAIQSDTSQFAKSAPQQVFVDSARIASTFPDNTVTSSKIVDHTIQRADVVTNFKAPAADSADYVRNLPSIPIADSARISGTIADGAVTTVKLNHTGASPGQTLTWNGNQVVWGTPSGANLWQQSGSNVYYTSGNVGIGTSAPRSKLDLNFGTSGSLLAATPQGGGPGFIFYAPNGHRREIAATNNDLYIGVSSDSNAGGGMMLKESGQLFVPFIMAAGIQFWDSSYQTTAVRRPFSPGISTDEIADGAVSASKLDIPLSLNSSSYSPILWATNSGGGHAVQGMNTGTGRGGLFQIYNGSNPSDALESVTDGSGRAAYFHIANGSNFNAAMSAATDGSGSGMLGINYGTGRGALAQIQNSVNPSDALEGVTDGTGRAAYFHVANSSNGNPAVRATTTGTGDGIEGYTLAGREGVFGQSDKVDGYGVVGIANNGSNSAGVIGQCAFGQGVWGGASDTGIGVYGYTEKGKAGVYGYNVNGPNGVYGYSAKSNGTGVQGLANGSNAYGVWGLSKDGYGVYGSTINGAAVFCSGMFVQVGGVFEAFPTSTLWTTNKPATVKLSDGTKVKLFSEEAAEVYFNDYGEGRLNGGMAHIELDPTFLQTVTIDARHTIKVFVQLEDDCNGVYVTNKTSTGFDVFELRGGKSNAQFTYRVVCKRKFYEDERLATEEQDLQFNKKVLETVWPEVTEKVRTERAKLELMDDQAPQQGRRFKDK